MSRTGLAAGHSLGDDLAAGFSLDGDFTTIRLGDRLRQARLNAGHDQVAATEDIGIQRNQLSKLERDLVRNPHPNTKAKILDYLRTYSKPRPKPESE